MARQRNATQNVVGKPAKGDWRQYFRGGTFLRRLVAESGDIDIHVVRADKSETATSEPIFTPRAKPPWNQYLVSLGVVAALTVVNVFLARVIGYRAVGFDFLLAVVVLALFVGRGPILLGAALSALCWDFFFVPPPFTFRITQRTERRDDVWGYFASSWRWVMGQLISAVSHAGEGRTAARGAHHGAVFADAGIGGRGDGGRNCKRDGATYRKIIWRGSGGIVDGR